MDTMRKMMSIFIDYNFDMKLEKILSTEQQNNAISPEDIEVLMKALLDKDEQTSQEKAMEILIEKFRHTKNLTIHQKFKLYCLKDMLIDKNQFWQQEYILNEQFKQEPAQNQGSKNQPQSLNKNYQLQNYILDYCDHLIYKSQLIE